LRFRILKDPSTVSQGMSRIETRETFSFGKKKLLIQVVISGALNSQHLPFGIKIFYHVRIYALKPLLQVAVLQLIRLVN
jgi:hypothetical protein